MWFEFCRQLYYFSPACTVAPPHSKHWPRFISASLLGSLSDAVGHVTMDDKHEEHRQRLRTIQTAHSADHIMAGLKGLGLGLYGGLTSIVSQTYTGATQEGLPVSAEMFCLYHILKYLG